MSELQIGSRIYEATFDDNGEAVQLSRYDEASKMQITLSFDNTADGSVTDRLLESLKNRYLASFT